MLDYKTFKENVIKNAIDTASALEMEIMMAKVEGQELQRQIQNLLKGTSESDKVFKEKIQKFLAEGSSAANPEVEEARKRQVDEQVDSKIQGAFEKLRNDNLYIWKQSLEIAQKEFSEKGVAQTMSLLPKTILDRGDLKRTVNSLLMDEQAQQPKPEVIGAPSQTQLSVAGSQKQQEPADDLASQANSSPNKSVPGVASEKGADKSAEK